jgi:hypothetical protein
LQKQLPIARVRIRDPIGTTLVAYHYTTSWLCYKLTGNTFLMVVR